MKNKIREIRKAQDKTLLDVAKEVGCSVAFLSDMELQRRSARVSTWQRIADALGVTVQELKGADDDVDNRAGSGGAGGVAGHDPAASA